MYSKYRLSIGLLLFERQSLVPPVCIYWSVFVIAALQVNTGMSIGAGDAQLRFDWKSFINFGDYMCFFRFRLHWAFFHNSGRVWDDWSRSACPFLIAMSLTYLPSGESHRGGLKFVMEHIPKCPLALKADLRCWWGLREIQVLVSNWDLERLQYADRMSVYCLSVAKQHYYTSW